MTPKEKAIELVINMFNQISDGVSYRNIDESYAAKLCALIAVDELIQFGNESGIREPMMYWNEVKSELEKL